MYSRKTAFTLVFSFLIQLLFFIPGFGQQQDSLTFTGKASFYHDNFQGLPTSSGEEYDMNDFTAAHKTLPFGTFVHVTNKHNGKSVIVRINDRGPFKKSRIIDLTRASAMKLGMVPFGVVPVKIQVLTLLDHVAGTDSTLHDNELWDCYGNKTELTDTSIFVWRTESIQHAFYMASDMLLDYHLEKVFVRVRGDLPARKYELIVSGLDGQQAKSLLKAMKEDGFRFARLLKP